MATIKSYTDISQSNKLAEILPIETSDMYWDLLSKDKYAKVNNIGHCLGRTCIYAWSLAVLLNVIPKPDLVQNSEGTWLVRSWINDYPWSVGGYSNPIDACVAMLEKLHELKML